MVWRELLGLEKKLGGETGLERMHQRVISEMKLVRVTIMYKVWVG